MMNENVGRLILRLLLGILMLFHGIDKLTRGIGWISNLVTGAGLPAFVAYGVYLGEVIAPLLIIAGWYSRVGAILIAVTMIFAVGLVHAADVFALNKVGGWAIELQGLYFFAAIAVALLGPGRFSINSR